MALNVLVVDDSDVIRTMILKTLRLADVPVATAFEAGNGREALGIIDANWIDLVLADINMPIMDGLEMLRRLRSDSRHSTLPVIVVTTEGSTERMAELEEAGVSAYIRKPFTPEMIRDIVDGVTSSLRPAQHVADELSDVFQQVLERFAMMDGMPADRDLPGLMSEECDLLQASMRFSGAVEGAVTIAAPLEVCLDMAANVTGGDPDGQDVMCRACDALGEVLNITAGSLVLELEPARQTDLAPPVVLGMDMREWEAMVADSTTLVFDVEGTPVLVSGVVKRQR